MVYTLYESKNQLKQMWKGNTYNKTLWINIYMSKRKLKMGIKVKEFLKQYQQNAS